MHILRNLTYEINWIKWAWTLSGIGLNGRKEGLPRSEINLRRALHRARQPFRGEHPISRDWEEDFPHENGNYNNKCCECDRNFVGHKERVVCHRCIWESKQALARLSKEDHDEIMYRRHVEAMQILKPGIEINEAKRLAIAATGYRPGVHDDIGTCANNQSTDAGS